MNDRLHKPSRLKAPAETTSKGVRKKLKKKMKKKKKVNGLPVKLCRTNLRKEKNCVKRKDRRKKLTKKKRQVKNSIQSASEPTDQDLNVKALICESTSRSLPALCDISETQVKLCDTSNVSSTLNGHQTVVEGPGDQHTVTARAENSADSRKTRKGKRTLDEGVSWTPQKRQRLAVELSLLLNVQQSVDGEVGTPQKEASSKVQEKKTSPSPNSRNDFKAEDTRDGASMSSFATSHAALWLKGQHSPLLEIPRPLSPVIPPPEEYVALDCEFVGVGLNNLNALGRCSIINFDGHVLYDKVVRPQDPITDYRTPWSGLRPTDMQGAIPFHLARAEIAKIIQHRIVIGHAVFNDFRVMNLRHPQCHIRDTSQCQDLQILMDQKNTRARSLRDMTLALLGQKIQTGEHDSVEDARAALELYKRVRDTWEIRLLSQSSIAATRASPPQGLYMGPAYSPPPMPAYSCAPQSVMVSVRPPPIQYTPVTYFDDRYWPVNGRM